MQRQRASLKKKQSKKTETKEKRRKNVLTGCLLSLNLFSTSTLLSSPFSLSSLQVLHLDRNPYYGGASASLNLNQLYERHAPKPPAVAPTPPAPTPPPPPPPPETAASSAAAAEGGGEEGESAAAPAPPPPPPPAPPAPLPPAHLGPSRDYNVDTVPKFIMGGGKLVRVLVRTKVTRYLEFKAVDGSFVFSSGRVERVPATDMEALRSPLLGLLEKRRARNFFIFVQDYKEEDPRTHGGRDLRRMPMAALYAEFGLAPATVDFVGHALALHTDDSYMNRPALDTVKRIQLYHDSLFRQGEEEGRERVGGGREKEERRRRERERVEKNSKKNFKKKNSLSQVRGRPLALHLPDVRPRGAPAGLCKARRGPRGEI